MLKNDIYFNNVCIFDYQVTEFINVLIYFESSMAQFSFKLKCSKSLYILNRLRATFKICKTLWIVNPSNFIINIYICIYTPVETTF